MSLKYYPSILLPTSSYALPSLPVCLQEARGQGEVIYADGQWQAHHPQESTTSIGHILNCPHGWETSSFLPGDQFFLTYETF